MNTTPRFFLYTRKSTDEADRQVLSIQAQLFELRELVKREGLVVIEEFQESRTAKSPGRPIFNSMIARIEAGEANGIIAWHPDRLARNSMDGGRIIYLTDTGRITELKFPTFRFDSTAQGKFMLSIAFSQSKYYVDNLSENIRRGIRQKLRNGIWPHWAPMGYKNDTERKTIVVDPEKAPLIRKAFELYATGDYSLAQVRERINQAGLIGRKGKTLSINNYHVMLQNPLFYGMIRFKGEVYEGKHDPIITKRLFDRVQEVLKRKCKPKTPGLKNYRYRGMFCCGECGCTITAETQKGHVYLRCTKRRGQCHQRYVQEPVVSEQVFEAIERASLPADWADPMLATIAAEQESLRQETERTALKFQADLASCESRLDALLDLFLQNQISQEEYAKKKQVLVTNKIELREKLTALEGKRGKRFEPLVEFIKEAKQATFLAKEKNPDSCRDFLKKHGSNLVLTDQRVRIEFKNP